GLVDSSLGERTRHRIVRGSLMERYLLATVGRLGLVFLALLPAGRARGEDSAPPGWSPRSAAAYLDGRTDWWLTWSRSARGQGTACLSCHTTLPLALARHAVASWPGGRRG